MTSFFAASVKLQVDRFPRYTFDLAMLLVILRESWFCWKTVFFMRSYALPILSSHYQTSSMDYSIQLFLSSEHKQMMSAVEMNDAQLLVTQNRPPQGCGINFL